MPRKRNRVPASGARKAAVANVLAIAKLINMLFGIDPQLNPFNRIPFII